MNAEETVFKSENQFDTSSFLSKTQKKESNLRDIATHYDLFSKFFKHHELSQEEKDDIRDLVDKYFSSATSDKEILRNARWQIECMNFDNLFSYGSCNKVDFANNVGIQIANLWCKHF